MIRLSIAAPRRAFATLGLLAGAAALAAGCTSASRPSASPGAAGASSPALPTAGAVTSGAAPATTAASAMPGTTVSAGAGAVGGGSARPAATAQAAGGGSGTTCLPRYLHADTGTSQGAAGSTYVAITFKNLNTKPCTLYGYPGVSAGAGTPVTQVGQPASRNSAVPSTVVTLAPGGYAYATLQVVDALNYPAATCHPQATSWLLVYPPNTSNLLYVPYNTKVCTTSTVSMSIQAVQPGNGS